MLRRNLLLWVAILLGLPLFAQQISEEDARAVAARFWQNANGVGVRSGVAAQPRLAYTSRKAGKACFYVFNRGTDAGFVIVGADGAAEEILGYSDNGTFDFDRIPDNLRWWLSQYEAQINAAMEAGATAESRAQTQQLRSLRASKANIAPLVQTTWNQDAPYNDMCPTIGGNPCFTGCVATAMAQIMKYHEYPAQGTGSHSYTWNNEAEGVTVGGEADFGATTYDWANMRDSYLPNEYQTEAQKKAIATLMYHCGVSLEMQYGTYASGAYDANVPNALTTYFGYDKAMSLLYRTYYTDEEWEQLVYDELSARRPVYYSGQTDEPAGHAFVCDGYKSSDNTFHFNWGWGGYCDGYYTVTGSKALNPGGSGIGGGEEGKGYIYNQVIITGIQPDKGGVARGIIGVGNCNAEAMRWNSTSGAWERPETVYPNDFIGLSANLMNISTVQADFIGGLKFTDPDMKEVLYAPTMQSLSLPSGYSYGVYDEKNAFQVDMSNTKLTPGVLYEVNYMYKLDGESEWQPVHFPASCGDVSSELKITKATLPEVVECGFADNEAVPLDGYELKVMLKNTGTTTYSKLLYAKVYEVNGDDKPINVGCFNKSGGKIEPGETGTYVLTSKEFTPADGMELQVGKRYFLRIIVDNLSAPAVLATCYFTFKDMKTYEVTYMVDGKVQGKQNVLPGSSITPLEAPAKEGYTFKGWKGLPEQMPSENITVEAEYTVNSYDLVFMVDGEEYARQSVEYGAKPEAAAAPEKEGHTFSGWDGLPETMPAEEVTVTAKFTVNTYEVVYTADGKELARESVEFGTALTPPEAPAKEGYTFKGWKGLPEQMPAENITVEAEYTVNSYDLVFMVDGEEYARQSVEYGTKPEAAAAPEKEGHTFSGWDGLPETMPAEEVTVTGTFTVNTYTLTYYLDGEVYKTETVEYGAEIVPPTVADTDEYLFEGWQDVPETMPAHDVTVQGTTRPTGIEGLTVGTMVDVYDLRGVLFRKGIAVERLRTELPAGMYIVNGRKLWIRK